MINQIRLKHIISKYGNKINFKLKKEMPNISFEEKKTIDSSINDKNLVISKVDKGNAIVVLNRDDYLNKA